MSDPSSSQLLDEFLAYALAGDSRRGAGQVLRMLDDGVPAETIITDLLAPAQREVGERWHRNELGVADEHLVTGVTESALHALAGAETVPGTTGLVVVACAEGDWHALSARMFAEQLRGRGVVVAFLGPSTPADHVARFVKRHRPDALAISCSLPIFYGGIARLTDVAHGFGVPVLAGGRALHDAPERADRLGVDAYAEDIDEALATLAGWRKRPPVLRPDATPLPVDAIELEGRAGELGAAAFGELVRRFPPLAGYDAQQVARTREDLVFIVQFVAAALLVDDPSVLTTFLDWLGELLAERDVPPAALAGGLGALHLLISAVSPAGGRLGELGLRHLADAS